MLKPRGAARFALPVLAGASAALGADLRVNTYTTGDQRSPSVAQAGPGTAVVVWQSSGQSSQLVGQRVDGTGGPVSPEFVVGGSTGSAVKGASVAADAAGNFVVVWSDSETGNPPLTKVLGQRFDGAGAPLGGVFRVSTYTTSAGHANVARSAGGGFVVTWCGAYPGQPFPVLARRFGEDGAAIGVEFVVGSSTALLFTGRPGLATDAAGNFIVTWEPPHSLEEPYADVLARRFALDGAPLTDAFRVNTYTSCNQSRSAAAAEPDGTFLVVWTSAGECSVGQPSQDGDQGGVFAQRFGAAGAPAGQEFRVNTATSGGQAPYGVLANAAGGFTVVWKDADVSGSGAQIFGRRFGADGAPLGPDARVNELTSATLTEPAVARDGGGLIVVWTGADGDAGGIFSRVAGPFPAGDADGSGTVNVSDVLYLINDLFAGGPPPAGDGDANGDHAVDVSDVLYLINHLFAGGPAPL